MKKEEIKVPDPKQQLWDIIRNVEERRMNGQWYSSITIHRGRVIELSIPWQNVPILKSIFREYEAYNALEKLKCDFGPDYKYPERFEFAMEFGGHLFIILNDGRY